MINNNYNNINHYMQQNTKDWIQYISAVSLIGSAIVIAFSCFYALNEITSGVNACIGIALSSALAIFGITTYFNNQLATFRSEAREEIKNIKEEARKEIKRIKEEEEKHDHTN